MPRSPRPAVGGIPYHVLHRGNNHQPIFFEDRDYTYFLQLLREGREKYPVKIYSYVLMANHIHLLIEPREQYNLAKYMRWVFAKYTQYINWKYQRTGTLWEGRYKSTIVEKERYFLACLRYIEMNPLRANLVRELKEYKRSSHMSHAYGMEDKILDKNEWYESLGETGEKKQRAYREFFKETIPEHEWDSIREATTKCGILAGNRFKEEIEKEIGRKLGPKRRGRPKK